MRSAEPGSSPPGADEGDRRLRAYDWSATPLGPVAAWPDDLKTAVAAALAPADATSSAPLTTDAVNAFLVRFSDAVLQEADPQEIARFACQLVADTLDVERAYWADVDWTTREYVIGAAVHRPGVPVIAGRFPLDAWEPFTSYHLGGRSVVVDDTQADGRVSGDMRAAYAQMAVGADLATPIVVNGQLRCTLAVNQQRPRRWTETEVALVRGIASRCWAAVDRAQSEAALRESERRHRLLFENMSEGFALAEMIWDEDGQPVDWRYLEVNGAWAQTGVPVSQTVGKTAREVNPAIEPYWIETYARVVQTGQAVTFENYAAGFERWFDTIAFKHSENCFGLLFRDVTARQQTDAALLRNARWSRAQNLAFEAAMDGAPLAASLTVLADMVHEETAGKARTAFYLADADGARLHPVRGAGTMADAYLDAVDGFLISEDSLACGLAVPTGLPVITPNVCTEPRWEPWAWMAHTFDFQGCWSFPIKTRDRRAVGTFAMYFRDERDATAEDLALAEAVTQAAAVIIASTTEAHDRERAEAALRESEERYRTLFTTIDEGYARYEVLFDDAGEPTDVRILEVNPAYERLTSRHNSAGKLLSEVSPGLDPAWGAAMAQVVRTGQPVRFEGLNTKIDRWFDVFIGPMNGPGDPHIVQTLTDITGRKQATARLQASEARQAFLLQFSDTLRPLADTAEIQRVAMRLVGEHLQADGAVYSELRDDGETIHIEDTVVHGTLPIRRGDFPLHAFGAAMDVLRRGGALIIEDQAATTLLTPVEQEASTSRVISASATVPVITSGRWVANFSVLHRRPRQWTADEITILHEAAERTWAALEHVRAQEFLRASEAQLSLELADAAQLQGVSSQLQLGGKSDALYGQILDAAVSLMRADSGCMHMLDPERTELVLLAARGLAPAATANWTRMARDANSASARALASGERRIVPDIETSAFMARTADLDAYQAAGRFAVQFTPLLARDGRPVGLLTTHWRSIHQPSERELRLLDVLARQAADLLERARAADALRESEERYRLIVDRATDYAIFSTDRERRIETWPPGAVAVYGWTAEEAVGQLMDITYAPEDRAAGVPEEEFAQARDTGHAPNVRWHLRKDGTYVFIEGDAYARQTEAGSFEGVFKIGQDITARLAAEEAQREEEAARREEEAVLRDELEVQVRAATAELRTLSRRLLAVQEEERRNLALELHDEIGQILTGLTFQLASVQGVNGADALNEARATVQGLTDQVRQMALDLRPQVLDRYGLLAALEWHIERFQAKTGITVHFRQQGLEERFSPEVEIAAFRVVQEALTNVARHSGVDFVTVQVHGDGVLTLVIRDSGHGFDPAQGGASTGLGGMRERVELLGGRLEVESRPGFGTTIIAELPAGTEG